MKIAVDFDDVIVDTMELFIEEWNRKYHLPFAPYLKRNQIYTWNLPRQLGCEPSVVRGVYEVLDYSNVRTFEAAVAFINKLRDDGHSVIVLSSNPRFEDLRNWMSSHGLQRVALKAGIGNKAGWLRDNDYDILIDDRPTYLKGATTVGAHAIRFLQPWNKSMERDGWGNTDWDHSAITWDDVYKVIQEIIVIRLAEKVSKLRRGELPNLDVVSKVQTGGVNFGQGNDVKIGTPVVGQVVANKHGAKQTKIAGDYTLLPPLAVKEVAIVLEEGAAKYGVGNWEKLSIDEILNHVYAHLIEYGQEANTDDLSHAACRILMALQLHIEANK